MPKSSTHFSSFIWHRGGGHNWGNICPLPPAELLKLYPSFGTFKEIRQRLDSQGVFRNAWISELIRENVLESTDTSAATPSHDRSNLETT